MKSSHTLIIKGLHVVSGDVEILKGVTLTIRSGETHVIMGPNGSGKSTLLLALMGHPKYTITQGTVALDDKDVLAMSPTERARMGMFLGFQYPCEVAGVTLSNFLRLAKNAHIKARDEQTPGLAPAAFVAPMKEALASVGLDSRFMGRPLNEGFSGGEKKRAEVAQMKVLAPTFALLDEIDSGLDVDALHTVSESLRKTYQDTGCGLLLITHYGRLLEYLSPDYVHIMTDGRIQKTGDKSLADEVERKGYDQLVSV